MIKFYLTENKTLSNTPRSHLIEGDVFRALNTCITVIVTALKRNPATSFGFKEQLSNGQSFRDNKNVRV